MFDGFILIAAVYLIVKHFIFDFTSAQTPWMYQNKGTYGHSGGIAHSAIQAFASGIFFIWCATWMHWSRPEIWHTLTELQMVGALMVFEFLVHYHMDWLKVRICSDMGWSEYIKETSTMALPTLRNIEPHLAIFSGKYFLWLGIDQLVHYLTYVIMVWAWVA